MRPTLYRPRAAALAALLVLPALFSGCAKPVTTGGGSGGGSAKPANAIAVGEYGSLTGQTSTFGTSTKEGIDLSIAQTNAAGGVNGHPLWIQLYDDAGQPDQALSVVKRLVTQDDVTAVLGEVASSNSIAAAPACQEAKVPMISPSSTNPKVTQEGDYIFRVCFIDPVQGKAAAEFAFNNLHAKTAAIMTDQKSDYSQGLHDVFKADFTKLGGKVVGEATYTADDLNFQAQCTGFKAENPDVLYVPGYYSQVGPIAHDAKTVGLTCPLLGGDGWDSPKLLEGAQGGLEGSYFTNHYSQTNPDPVTQKFVKDYTAKYGHTPDSLAAMGFDAAGVLADAMKRAGAPADGNYDSADYRAKLRDAIASTVKFHGATGFITIGPDRNAVKPVVVLQVKGNAFQYVTTVAP